MKITYWSDYACPYCYIGEERLNKALAALGYQDIELEMKAFQLDPSAGLHATGDTQTRFALKYNISREQAGEQIEHISSLGRAEGLDFRYATTLFTNTMDAHRLTKLAQKKGLEQAVIQALFKAYFTDNRELADKEVLRSVGAACGLASSDIDGVLNTDAFQDDVLRDEREAYQLGIHAVPFFVIGGQGIAGSRSIEGMMAAIREAHGEERMNPAPEQGVRCGSKGCEIR